MALTNPQKEECARQLAHKLFVEAAATAGIHHDDLLAAVAAVDAAFDSTLTAATAAAGGGTTIISYLAGQIPAPASGGTAQQKTLLGCYVLMKRAGLI